MLNLSVCPNGRIVIYKCRVHEFYSIYSLLLGKISTTNSYVSVLRLISKHVTDSGSTEVGS